VIAKITRGTSFKGAARYVLDERHGLDHAHQPEIVGGNMAGRSSGELTREFEAVRQQRPDIRKPVEHVSLSFARDERKLSNDEIARIADAYLRKRGHDLDRLQYMVVRHRDKEHAHCHILLNRIRTDATVVPQVYREYLRSKEACRTLEREFGLRQVQERSRFGDRAPTRAEDRMSRDRGLVSEKEQIKALIREAAQGNPTMSHFVKRLEDKGVQVRPNIAKTGHVSGISYRLDRVAVKGSGLGRAYSFAGLQEEQGVRFDPARDLVALERASRATEGLEPLRRRGPRRPRIPTPMRELDRVPAVRAARTALWLARNMELAARSPGRAAMNVVERVLPSDARTAVRVIRKVIDLSRGR